ncbi:MAG: glycosyltransferase family 4 protein [Proteobacteria bacterium]|nr:glycosyltransferase family 4 protein [Pseudomonadota bacterium]
MHVEMGRHLYGGARQVAYLLNGLKEHPGEYGLVCAAGAEIIGAITNPDVKIHRIKTKGDLDVHFIGRLREVIRREKPDMLHIHSRRGDMLSALAGRLEKLPMVHSRRVDNPPSFFDLHFKFPLFKTIITISKGIREVLLEAGVPTNRVICIPSAVDTEQFRPVRVNRQGFLQEFGLTGDGPVLAMIAQLIPRKGHAVFFEALPAILAKHPRTRVLIFGRGPLKDELTRAVQKQGLDKFVRFEGFRTDLEHVIPHVDMVVHPAFMEGLGVSLLEAAACGVPIVACRAGGIPEIVRDKFNGFLVKPGDSKSLARHIIALLDEPDQLQLFSLTGRELVLEHFSIERMVRDNHRVYLETLGIQ